MYGIIWQTDDERWQLWFVVVCHISFDWFYLNIVTNRRRDDKAELLWESNKHITDSLPMGKTSKHVWMKYDLKFNYFFRLENVGFKQF